MMAVATGDTECRRRADYIVSELEACQKAIGTGMLAAFPDSRGLFAELAAGKIDSDHLFKLNGGYVPFYVIHKVMAGLRDAWLLLGNQTAKAVLIRQADWLQTVFEKLTDQQVQDILETEHGGIVEVVADVYSLTGGAKYLQLAQAAQPPEDLRAPGQGRRSAHLSASCPPRPRQRPDPDRHRHGAPVRGDGREGLRRLLPRPSGTMWRAHGPSSSAATAATSSSSLWRSSPRPG